VRAFIIHCHPEATSFNAALTERAVRTLSSEGWSVEVSDLYKEGFDPVEKREHYRHRNDPEVFAPLGEQRHAYATGTLPGDVKREIARLERADLVILQFPLWWHAQPAMLKGWFDRVFVSGGLYSSGKRYDAGHFRGKLAVCSVTSGAPELDFGPGSRGGDLDVMLWPPTTHIIDPAVDEARFYVEQDLLYSQRVHRIGLVDGIGPAPFDDPRLNAEGDPYFTDGLRAVFFVGRDLIPMDKLQVLNWNLPAQLEPFRENIFGDTPTNAYDHR